MARLARVRACVCVCAFVDGYTWLLSFIGRIGATFGDQVNNQYDYSRILGTAYRVIFMVIVGLLLLNLVIAIMTTAYETALTDSGDAYWANRQFQAITMEDRSAAVLSSECLCSGAHLSLSRY